MTQKPRKPTDHDRLVLFGAVAASMAVIVGLWLILLPGELNLSSQASKPSKIWEVLRNDGQETINSWDQSVGQLRDSLNELPANQRLEAAEAAKDLNQEELDRFRSKLEAASIEKEENPNQHDSQEKDSE